MQKIINNEPLLDFQDVLIRPIRSEFSLTRKDVSIYTSWCETETIIPIAISNMMSTGTYKIANILTPRRVLTFLHKEYTAEEHFKNLEKMSNRKFIAITSGVQEWDIEKTDKILERYSDIGLINIDIANVYANMEAIIKTIKHYKNKFPSVHISAGNIADSSLVKDLAEAGVSYVKVGVGSGSACKTRSEVGVGVPQLSALIDVCSESKKHKVKVISDGGCVTAGDVCKAIAAGADIVMIAGMVSKSEECDNIIEIDGKKYVNFYGLGSSIMYNLTNPTEKEYRPNEGRNLLIPCSGSIIDVIKQIEGGLRSVCTYVGIKNITELANVSKFIKVNHTINNSLAKYEK